MSSARKHEDGDILNDGTPWKQTEPKTQTDLVSELTLANSRRSSCSAARGGSARTSLMPWNTSSEPRSLQVETRLLALQPLSRLHVGVLAVGTPPFAACLAPLRPPRVQDYRLRPVLIPASLRLGLIWYIWTRAGGNQQQHTNILQPKLVFTRSLWSRAIYWITRAWLRHVSINLI